MSAGQWLLGQAKAIRVAVLASICLVVGFDAHAADDQLNDDEVAHVRTLLSHLTRKELGTLLLLSERLGTDGVAKLDLLLRHVTVEDGSGGLLGPVVVIEGANVQIRSGSGSTVDASGLGNLVIGHNEPAATIARGGSHNLVIGPEHNFTSDGGLVVGAKNTVAGTHASVLGGMGNEVRSNYGAILGGTQNVVHAPRGVVVGGIENEVSGYEGVVVGGESNEVQPGTRAGVVTGGFQNVAAVGEYVWLGGGERNHVRTHKGAIVGGSQNIVDSGTGPSGFVGEAAVICGGKENRTRQDWSSISGGWRKEISHQAPQAAWCAGAASGDFGDCK